MFTDPVHCVLRHIQTHRQTHILFAWLQFYRRSNFFNTNDLPWFITQTFSTIITELYWTIVLLLFLIIDIPVSLTQQPQCGQNTGDIVPHCYLQWGGEKEEKKGERDNGERKRQREGEMEERGRCSRVYSVKLWVLWKRNKNDGGQQGMTHNTEKGDVRVVRDEIEKKRGERSRSEHSRKRGSTQRSLYFQSQ